MLMVFPIYSRLQNSIERLFWAGNQGNHQNFEKNDTSYETQSCFHWKKTKTKIQNGPLKKWYFVTIIVLTYCEKKLF